MSALNKAIDKQLLKGLSPLDKLTHDKIDDIVSKSRVENLPAGRIIFRQGEDDGQTIYLLSGSIELAIAGKTRKQTIKGKSDEARYPIADKLPRPATAKTKTASSLLYIDASLLEILLNDNPSGEYEVTEIDIAHHATDWMMRFLQSRAFLKLPTENIQKVLMNMEEVHVQKGDAVVRQGDEGDYYYIIKHGCCVVSRRPTTKSEEVRLAKLVEGDGFGEEALITNSRRNATITTQENCTLMRLKKDDFLSLLVTPLIKNVHLNSLKSSLYKNSIILDIRTNDEFKQGSLDSAKHIPLSMIRLRIPTLDAGKQHLIYSSSKDDANAAAFLLAQHGINCMVILGSLNEAIQQTKQPTEEERPIPRSTVPELSIVSNETPPDDAKDISFSKLDELDTAKSPANQTIYPAKNIIADNSTQTDSKDDLEALAIQEKIKAEAENLRLQAINDAEKMLAEAENIRQSAIQDAYRLRDKIEKEETIKLRTQLEETRSKADAAIRRNEHLAEQSRRQAEQESSHILQQARGEAEKLRQELTLLREQEIQMKLQLEAELQAIRQQATEQARLREEQAAEQTRQKEEQDAERIRMAAKHATEEARKLALLEAEQARAIAEQESRQAMVAAEQARTQAISEAKETRAAAEKAAAQARAIADKMTENARAIEQKVEQARIRAEQEAETIRQSARQEAIKIKQSALDESYQIRQTATVETRSFISHDDVFSVDDELGQTITPVLPYADEASVALKMAEEIKARLEEVEEQRLENEQRASKKSLESKVELTRLDGKTILESEQDIFIFREPKQIPAETTLSEKTIIQPPSEYTQSIQRLVPIKDTFGELPCADISPNNFKSTDLPTAQMDCDYYEEAEKGKKGIIAIAASILLVISLSLVAYTTKIQINFSEVDALVNQDSIETEETKLKTEARQEFRKKLSSITTK